jgi:hypothetical protein
MKYESTNIKIVTNKRMNLLTIEQNGKTPCFIEYEHIDELNNLLIDIIMLEKYGEDTRTKTTELPS